MKWFRLLAGVFAFNVAYAQQPPALPPGPSGGTSPGVSVLRPEYAPPGVPPGAATAADGTVALIELRDLLRAQTEAIRALSGKVDSLEERLRRIEGKLR
jgi:hypothetical protein